MQLLPGNKVYFASDFHLGAPDAKSSALRERKIVRWLEEIRPDAGVVFLLGDIFDFWFEYRHAIPRGFVRLQGKLAEFTDSGIPVIFFTGNHDMWMFDYFTQELNIPIYRKPVSTSIGDHTFYIGHGDGLGPKDHTYKVLKRVFANPLSQWLFARIHPNTGIAVANAWSRKSRASQGEPEKAMQNIEDEWLVHYCREVEATQHHDFYVFGHRHLPLDLPIGHQARYVNLGEWVNFCTYAVYDGQQLHIRYFEKETAM